MHIKVEGHTCRVRFSKWFRIQADTIKYKTSHFMYGTIALSITFTLHFWTYGAISKTKQTLSTKLFYRYDFYQYKCHDTICTQTYLSLTAPRALTFFNKISPFKLYVTCSCACFLLYDCENYVTVYSIQYIVYRM